MAQTILIVDDDDMQLTSFLSRFPGKHGFEAKTACSGTQTRALLARENFALIVLDLNLPDADGLRIARLRSEIDSTRTGASLIQAVQGEGYVLAAEVDIV